jgi:hypothetical protein
MTLAIAESRWTLVAGWIEGGQHGVLGLGGPRAEANIPCHQCRLFWRCDLAGICLSSSGSVIQVGHNHYSSFTESTAPARPCLFHELSDGWNLFSCNLYPCEQKNINDAEDVIASSSSVTSTTWYLFVGTVSLPAR